MIRNPESCVAAANADYHRRVPIEELNREAAREIDDQMDRIFESWAGEAE